jgi:hypothetical protein
LADFLGYLYCTLPINISKNALFPRGRGWGNRPMKSGGWNIKSEGKSGEYEKKIREVEKKILNESRK